MAQQTQISRVSEAWASFLAAFPTIRALADATPAEVLRAWRGLGYNRRALNLWRAAQAVVADHDGELPRDVAALERLPGIGPYTARAGRGDRVRAAGRGGRHERPARARAGAHGIARRHSPARLQAVADASVPAGQVGPTGRTP
jgi:hypothetical protein